MPMLYLAICRSLVLPTLASSNHSEPSVLGSVSRSEGHECQPPKINAIFVGSIEAMRLIGKRNPPRLPGDTFLVQGSDRIPYRRASYPP
jgi:hypothetical protein